MSYRSVVLALASCSILAAQGNPAKLEASKPAAQQIRVNRLPESSRVVGNEKTVGAASAGNFRAAEDRNIIGNAKTVGGDAHYAAFEVAETVGNSKTVGGR